MLRAFVASTLLLASACAHHPAREAASTALVTPVLHLQPWGVGLPPSTPFHVRTADGLVLEGERFTPDGPSRGQVLYLHGRDSGRRHADPAVRFFLARGYSVAAYDSRAHGRSEGQRATYGAREVDDVRRVLDALWGPAPVLLMGHSMGAAVALQAAAADPRVQAVISASAFADLTDEWSDVLARAHLDREEIDATVRRAEEQAGFEARQISPERCAATLRIPVLLVHGTQDALIHPAHARRLQRALGAHGELVWLDGAAHNDVLDYPQTWAAIDAWLGRHPGPRAG